MIPNGGSIHTAATTGYASMWNAVVDGMIAQGINNANATIEFAWEGYGGNAWGGVNTTDPATNVQSTTTDWVAGFRNGITTMRAHGLSSSVGICWNVMSNGYSSTQLALMYPGDDVVDIIGWDGYAGNRFGGSVDRTNYQLIYDTQQKPDLDTVTKFARARGKRASMGEFGFIQPIPGDTTSNAYTYRPADSYLYFQLFYEYFKANADIWAYVCHFNQNQYGSVDGTGKSPISEDTQMVYLGTNPATQTYPYTRNTSSTGPAYLTTSAQHAATKSLGSFLDYFGGRAGRGGGTMLYTAPPPAAPGVSVAATASLRPLRHRRGWIKA
jgi:hypothetical protein